MREEAGLPEQLPTIADEMEEAAPVSDSDIERFVCCFPSTLNESEQNRL